jgi:hypothetical protein
MVVVGMCMGVIVLIDELLKQILLLLLVVDLDKTR